MAEHWCKEHQAIYFKRGKMKGYAHPILDEEGEATGEWCNESKEAPEPEAKQVTPKADMTKNDWAEKDRITRKSIERQKSLDLGVRVCELSGIKTGITEKAITTARAFEAYLETGKEYLGKEVQKSHLVEAAKKMGAKEITEEVS